MIAALLFAFFGGATAGAYVMYRQLPKAIERAKEEKTRKIEDSFAPIRKALQEGALTKKDVEELGIVLPEDAQQQELQQKQAASEAYQRMKAKQEKEIQQAKAIGESWRRLLTLESLSRIKEAEKGKP